MRFDLALDRMFSLFLALVKDALRRVGKSLEEEELRMS
jgi:hypothetical protein